jgi:hypothetical protein
MESSMERLEVVTVGDDDDKEVVVSHKNLL